MLFVAAIIIGAVSGLVAKPLMPGRPPGGFLVPIALGILGALLATATVWVAGWGSDVGAGLIAAAAGAVLALLIERLIRA